MNIRWVYDGTMRSLNNERLLLLALSPSPFQDTAVQTTEAETLAFLLFLGSPKSVLPFKIFDAKVGKVQPIQFAHTHGHLWGGLLGGLGVVVIIVVVVTRFLCRRGDRLESKNSRLFDRSLCW